jgi:hypothetical protein
MLHGVEPMRIGAGFLQQAVARTQRAFQCVHAAGMIGIDGEHQPVEEAAAFGRRAVEQRVHRRNHPDHPQVVRERRGRWNRLAVDAALARRRGSFAGRRLDAGSKRGEPERALHVARQRPRAVAFGEG